jgi:hypothetical protein
VGNLRQVGAGRREKVREKEWRETIGVVERATASNRALVTARRAEWVAIWRTLRDADGEISIDQPPRLAAHLLGYNHYSSPTGYLVIQR